MTVQSPYAVRNSAHGGFIRGPQAEEGSMQHKGTAVFLLLAFMAAGSTASAQSHTHGFFLNAQLNGSALKVEDSNGTDSGGGIGLGLGYGFTPAIAAFLNVDVASIRGSDDEPDYSLGHAELGVRYTFGQATARWRPSLDASLALRMATWDDVNFEGFGVGDVELTGPSYGVGGGLAYYFNPSLALNMGLRLHFGSFNEIKIDNVTFDLEGDEKISATSTRFNIGVAWYPAGRSALAARR
jgi:hypothetical protein